MSNFNVFFSPTGGTKKVADIVANQLFAQYEEIDLCREGKEITLTEQDICVISVPSYGGRVPAIAIERMKRISGNGAKAILNCVYGNRAWEDTLTELQDTLESIGFICVCAMATVAEHSIFRQFATGRPDEEDKKQLIAFAQKIQAKLESNQYGVLNLAGSHGTYKVYGGASFKPEGNENCIQCGLCVKECPVSAIDFDNPSKTNKEQCISCMRCVQLCPKHARDLDVEFVEKISNKIAPMLSGRKENYLFL